MRQETIALHSGFDCDPTTKAVAVPIYQTVAYSFDSAEHGAALFNLEVEGYPLVSVPQLYGTTHTLLAHILPKFGVKTRFARSDKPAELAALIDESTSAVFCETVGNPAGNVCDLEAMAEVAHRAGVPLIVDNTVPTPMLIRPIDYGADVVLHSLTKFLGGHGTTLGGIIVDAGNFPWQKYAARFPMLTQPDDSYHGLVYTEHYGPRAYIGRCRSVYQRTMGAVLPPLSAFAGFPDNPYYPLVQKYLGGRACSLLTFAIRGGYDAGTRFYDALRLFKRLVNLGDAKSLACHPASTTHRQMSAEEQRLAGIGPETLRLSVGIEHIDDIIADLDQALAAATRG